MKNYYFTYNMEWRKIIKFRRSITNSEIVLLFTIVNSFAHIKLKIQAAKMVPEKLLQGQEIVFHSGLLWTFFVSQYMFIKTFKKLVNLTTQI